jgi:N-acetylmuramoyl-L-alanine amidase
VCYNLLILLALSTASRNEKGEMGKAQLLLLIVALSAASAWAPYPDEGAVKLYDRAQRAYFELKSDEKLLSDPAAWQKVISAYRLVIDSYPNDPLVDDIIFIIGGVYKELYENFGERDALDKAIAGYRTILRDFPDSYLQQAALYSIGEIQEQFLYQPAEALATFQELVRRFPKGYKTSSAKQRIEELTSKKEPDAATKTKTSESGNGGSNKSGGIAGTDNPDSEPEPTIEPGVAPVIINDIRTSFGRNNGRVVIELSGDAKYEFKQLPAPNARIYFDLYNVDLSKSGLKTTEIAIDNRYLKRIRLGQNKSRVVRVVLDFDDFRRFNVFTLPAPFRIVFDLYGAGEGPSYLSAAGRIPGETETIREGASSNNSGSYSISRQLGAKISTIVLDPGHGGKDGGAQGVDGLKEKDVVLDIAKRLKTLIEKEMPGIQVKLTREDDRYISLEQRTALANSLEADLFFSIHANASRKHGRTSGIETYYMNFASDKEAEELAAKENAYSQLNQAKLNDLLKRITLNNKKEESRDLAGFVQTNLYRNTRPMNQYAQNRGVRSAPFVVLIGADVPSVLVEISFIDHQVEGKLLLTDEYRDRIAKGLLGGVKAYVESLQ